MWLRSDKRKSHSRSFCVHIIVYKNPAVVPVPVMTVTKFSTPLPWPNFLSASAAQLPSLSTQTGKCKASETGVLRSTEDHSWISFVECRTTPSCGFTRPPVEIPEQQIVKEGYIFFFTLREYELQVFSYQHPVFYSWGARHPAWHLCTSSIRDASCLQMSLDWSLCIFSLSCPEQWGKEGGMKGENHRDSVPP